MPPAYIFASSESPRQAHQMCACELHQMRTCLLHQMSECLPHQGRECIWRSTSSPAKKALEGLHRTSQDQETISQFHKDACYRSCTYQALPLTPNFVLQQVDSAPTCTVCC
eukprot:scaffold37680_cov23-Tisochrysis_lutea.AAC.1